MTVGEALVQLHDMAANEYPDDVEAVAVVRREIERLRADLRMLAGAIEAWEEPKNDGTREWSSRFRTYLRGHVIAQACFTLEEWTRVRQYMDKQEDSNGPGP